MRTAQAHDIPADIYSDTMEHMSTNPTARVLLRLPRRLHHELAALAAADGISLNQWILLALARSAEAQTKHDTSKETGA